MSIYKYKDNWKAEIWIDNRRITGKSGFPTKLDAKAWHDRTVMQYRTDPDQLNKPKQVLFDELLAKYQEIHLPSVSSVTASRYQVDIDHRIRKSWWNSFGPR